MRLLDNETSNLNFKFGETNSCVMYIKIKENPL